MFSPTVLIDLSNKFIQSLFIERLPHDPQDIGHHVGSDVSLPLGKAIKGLLQNYNNDFDTYANYTESSPSTNGCINGSIKIRPNSLIISE